MTYLTIAADNIAVCRNTSEVVKIKVRVYNTPVPNCHSIMPCKEIPGEHLTAFSSTKRLTSKGRFPLGVIFLVE